LSVLAVKRARILAASGVDPTRIAKDFGFNETELTNAVRGVTFTYVDDPPPVYQRPDRITGVGGGRLSGVKLDRAHLRKIRESRLRLSQEAFARRVRDVGQELGLPNRCTKRLVQKWEDGSHALPSVGYQIILVEVTGVSGFEELCMPSEPLPTRDVLGRLAALVPVLAEACRELVHVNRQLSGEPGLLRRGALPAVRAAAGNGDPEELAGEDTPGMVPGRGELVRGPRSPNRGG
jgi:hypothetical protein